MYGRYIFMYIHHKSQPNVGKYTSSMDPMGIKSQISSSSPHDFFCGGVRCLVFRCICQTTRNTEP